MATYATREVLSEVLAVISASTSLEFTTLTSVVPLAQETHESAVYISLEREILSIERQKPDISAYDRTLLIALYVNVDCGADTLLIYDKVNIIENIILEDTQLWDKIVDRDIVSVEYDNGEFSPKRTAVMLLEVKYRLTCS